MLEYHLGYFAWPDISHQNQCNCGNQFDVKETGSLKPVVPVVIIHSLEPSVCSNLSEFAIYILY